MAITVYKKTLLTGGTAPALDSIDGALLLDGDYAIVTVSAIDYAYILDDDLGGAENSPLIITPDTNPGNKRWVLQTPALAALTAAGDLPYASAVGVLTKLAKGAANLKLFMNAGATAPEWAAGLKIVEFTRAAAAASGDVAYTGAGFKPSMIIFVATGNTTFGYSVGGYDGTLHSVKFFYATAGVITSSNTTNCIMMMVDGDPTKYQKAIVKTLDADGFTLTWTLGGTGAPDVSFITAYCFR